MSNGYNQNTHHFSTPYLTLQEFKDAPTGVEIDNIVYYSTDSAAQDAELFNIITRASSWIDNICNQVLAATTETEQERTRYNKRGDLIFHPKYNPIIALTALSCGSRPDQMVSVADCSKAWIEDSQIVFPSNYISSLQLGSGTGYPRQEVYINYTYVNGYTNTTIATATSGATTLTVSDATGIIAGQSLRIYDGANTELVIVGSGYTFGSTTVPLVSALTHTHSAGISISALPAAIKEACILLTVALLKARGDSAMIMKQGNQPGEFIEIADKGSSDVAGAKRLLIPYKRVR